MLFCYLILEVKSEKANFWYIWG